MGKEQAKGKKLGFISDLGNVIATIDNSGPIQSLQPMIQSTEDPKEIEKILYASPSAPFWTHTVHADFHKGKISPIEFYEYMKDILQFKRALSYEVFSQTWPARFRLNPEVMDIIQEITTPRFLLSDTNELDVRWIKNQFPEIFRLFPHCFFSHDRGVDKYSHEAWRNVLEAYHLPPEDTLFVDDRPDHVARAKELKIRGVVFDGNVEKLKTTLQEHGAIPVKVN